LKSGFGAFGLFTGGLPADGRVTDGRFADGLSDEGRSTDGLPEGLSPPGLTPEFPEEGLEGFLSAGLISAFRSDDAGLSAFGFESGRGAADFTLPDDLLYVPEAVERDTEPEDLEVEVERETELERDVELERELLLDCAPVSNWKAVNANPISIAARVLTDNLMIEKV